MSMFPRHTILTRPRVAIIAAFCKFSSNIKFDISQAVEFAVIIPLSVLDWKTCDNIFKPKEMSCWLICRWLTFYREIISRSIQKYIWERCSEYNWKGRFMSRRNLETIKYKSRLKVASAIMMMYGRGYA